MTKENQKAEYSTYGEQIDYVGYGNEVEATGLNGEKTKENGTSFAAANVTAIIAKLKSTQIPNLEETMNKYAIDLGEEGKDQYYGNGLITLEKVEEDKIENEEIDLKVGIKDLEKWKEMTDEELNYYLTNIKESYLAIFLQGLSKEDLEEIIKRDTIVSYDYIVYGEEKEEERKPYYEYLLGIDFSKISVSAFESLEGHFTLNIVNGKDHEGNPVIDWEDSSLRIKTSVTKESSATSQIAKYALITKAEDNENYTINNHNAKVYGNVSGVYTRQYATKDENAAAQPKETYTDSSGVLWYKSAQYELYYLKLDYTKPAYTYATVSYPVRCTNGCRINLRDWDEETGWHNGGPDTTNAIGINHTDNVEQISMLIHAHNTGQSSTINNSVAVNAVAVLTLNYPTIAIKYDANGGTKEDETSYTTITYGTQGKDLLDWQELGIEKQGYHVIEGEEWTTEKTGGTKLNQDIIYPATDFIDFTDGDKKFVDDKDKPREMTVYANYEINSSTLTINPNGGMWNGSNQMQDFTQNYNTTKAIPIPTRENYVFTGWQRIGENGKMTSLTDYSTYTFGAEEGANDILVAQWKPNEYTLTVNPNGGTYNGSSENWVFTLQYGGSQKISVPVREGYKFVGWTLEGEGSKIEYLDGTPSGEASVMIGAENATITANWEAVDTSVIVHHYLEGTTTKVSPDITIQGKYGEHYETTVATNLEAKYELVTTPSNWTGTMGINPIEVTYYYRIKDSKGVIVHHIDKTTKEKIAPDVIIPENGQGKYGDSYTTQESAEIPANYIFSSKTANWQGTLIEEQIEVTYEYEKEKAEIKEEKIQKTGTTEITGKEDTVEYTISYSTKINKYIGNAEIEITDTLPYKIDEEKSEIAGGIYNEENKTIKWTETVKDINTYENGEKEIGINKTIKIVYKDIDIKQTEMTNQAEGKIKLLDTEQTTEGKETETTTKLNFKVESKAEKIWDDNNNANKKRPETITFVLKANGEEKQEQIVNTNEDTQNKYEYTFTNLEKYDEQGKEINYTIEERETNQEDLKFYTAQEITSIENRTKTTTITNKFTVPDEKVKVPVEIIWNDNENKAGKRPENVEVTVTGGNSQTVIINEEKGWKHTFENLPKYNEKGEEINYTVTQKDLNNKFYPETQITGDMNKGYIITNTFRVPDEKVEIKVTKQWIDTEEQKDKRSTSVTLIVSGNENRYEQKVTEQENWAHVFELPKYDENGDEIEYIADEGEIGSKFYTKTEVTGDMTNGYIITNTFQVPQETVDIPVTKIWKDNENANQKRPESITVTVSGNGQTQEAIITGEEEWKHTFTGLAKYNENGDEIQYIIDEKETNNEFYQKTSVDQETRTITNTFQVPGDTIKIKGKKEWNDKENEAGKRPENITLQIKNGNEVIQEGIVNEANKWEYEFTVSKYNESGNEIEYTIDEKETGSKFYQKEKTEGNMREGFTITNKFEVPDEKVQIDVHKIWNDNNNEAKKRPNAITLKLSGNGQEYKKELNSTMENEENTNQWDAKIEELPRYDSLGNEIKYILSEEETGSIFYTKENAEVNQEEKTITNTFKVPEETVNVKVRKNWEDTEEQKDKRSTSVTVEIAGDVTTKEATLNEAGNWEYTFTGLPKYDRLGNEVQYTVEEKELNNKFYENAGTTGNMEEGYVITNRFTVPEEKVEVPVTVVWNDNNNEAGKRPESTEITITGGKNTQTVTITNEEEWKHTFENLPKYDENGNEIGYTITQKDLENEFYPNTVISGNMENGYIITNIFQVPGDTINVKVKKNWEDTEKQKDKRSTSVTVEIAGDVTTKEAILNETGNWEYTFEGLPKYDRLGNEVNYIVSEKDLGNKFYENVGTTGNMQEGYVITNRFTVPEEKIEVPVEIIWKDNNNEAGKRPEKVEVTIIGEETTQTKEITEEQEWTYTFESLPKYDENGDEIQYKVSQKDLNNDFYKDPVITGDMKEGYEITNEFKVPGDTVNVKVTKNWIDTEEQKDKRTKAVKIEIKGDITKQETTLTEEENWEHTFEGLPKYDRLGNEVQYTVEEKELNNKFYENTGTTGNMEEGYVITNTFQVPEEFVKVQVTKQWIDTEEQKEKRSETVTLMVKGNNETYEQKVTEKDNWTYTYTLPKYDANGNEIKYTADEKDLGNKFYTKTAVAGDMANGFTITNTFQVPQETVDIPVTKIWNDNENINEKRPESITVTVKGNEQTQKARITEEENWKHTFTNLAKYDANGNEIQYTIDEEEVESEFYQKTSVDQKARTITNTFIVPGETIEIPVTKVWNDNNNEANKRPNEITVVLSGNGVDYERTLTKQNEIQTNKWEYIFTNLPKYDATGSEIQYILSEKETENKFYTKENTQINQEEKTITNTFKVPEEKVSIEVNKVWIDNEIQAQRRPETIELQIKGENGETVSTYELNTKTETSHTFENLPKYNDLGNEIEYTVEEIMNSNFYTKHIGEAVQSGTNEKTVAIINEFVKPEDKVNILVNKIWNDNEIQSQRRPESIIVVLKDKDRTIVSEEVTKDNTVSGTTNQWSTTFENVDKYDENGQEIKYTVEEKEKNTGDLKFYTKEITEVKDNQATIRNTFTKPEDTIEVKVQKTWEDNENENGKRPEKIKIVLSGNNKEIEQEISNNDNWAYTFEGLEKYDSNGQEIQYAVKEKEVVEGDLKFYSEEINGTNIINRFTVPEETTNLTVTKKWVDNDIQALRRPEQILINVKGENGQIVTKYQMNTKEEDTHIFEGLPKYNEKGDIITYTVEEKEVNENDLHFYDTQIGQTTNELVEGIATGNQKVTITNTFKVPEDKTQIEVTKQWKDNNNQSQKRPQSIKLQLKVDVEIIKEQVINGNDNKVSENVWNYIFTDLNKYDENGQEINYVVDETEVNSGDLQFYTKQVQGYNIINTFTQNTDKINMVVTKKWVDNVIQSQRRPESIIIQIKSGDTVVASKEITKANKVDDENTTWRVTFEDLPKYDSNNNIINYTVDEQEVNKEDMKFYTKQVSGTTITNTFTKPQDKIEITINKNWVDMDDKFERRPDVIKLQVKNQENVVQEITVSKESEWKATFSKIDKYDENGQEINYTVDEAEIYQNDLFNYTKDIGILENVQGQVGKKQATITNTFTKIPSTVTVKYIDKHTNEEIEDSVVMSGIIGESYDVAEHEKDISGYVLIERPEQTTGEYTSQAQEKVYYYAKTSKVVVKYLEKDTNKVLVEQSEIYGHEGLEYIANQKDIDGYTYVYDSKNTTGVMSREDIEVIYYYSQNTAVTVKYLDKNTNSEIAETVEMSGYVGKDYETEQKELEGYTFIESTDNTKGTMIKEGIEVIYYYSKNTKVMVKYLEKDTQNELSETIEIKGYVGKDYETEQKTIEGYTFVNSTNNIKGTMTENIIEVIYYYAQNTQIRVQYIDKETEEILKQEIIKGKVGDVVSTQVRDFEGYILIESPEDTNITMTKEEQIIKYYYVHISEGVVEKHIDMITGELLYAEEHKGNEGDKYNILSKEFEGYDLVKDKLPANNEGTMTKDLIEVKYYYIKKASVKVEYIVEATGEKLTEDIIINGHENDKYEAETKTFKGYILSKIPENSKGTMTVTKNPDGTYNTQITVTYYYTKQAGGVVERHIDINTNKVLEEVQHTGNIGDNYNIQQKEFEGYDLMKEKLPENSQGIMTEEEIVVNYYYEKIITIKVEYIDKYTDKVIYAEEIKGHKGEGYSTEAKEFDGYDLVEKPANGQGTMQNKDEVVKYYYQKKSEVEVQYLEKGTEYQIEDNVIIKGYVGDKYNTEAKDIPYYKLVEKATNPSGKMQEEKIIVKYYYEKEIFNLEINKWISNVNVNGIGQSAQNINNKDEIYKVDIHRKKVPTASVTVTYKIRVTNKGEIEGSADRITEIIPLGFTFNQEDNTVKWQNQNGVLTTEELKGQLIQPGQYKEIEITLRWQNSEENFGQKNNVVILNNITNPAGYKDIDEQNNTAKSEMIITIATGLDRNDRIILIGVIQIFLTITLGLLLSYKKRT